jgi:transcriptional regulator with XRE-family HTH domain
MSKHIKVNRLNRLPDGLRRQIIEARGKRGWSQAELGRRVGLPQMHISGIETGKIVPRYDTLLDLVRVLEFDLVMVPRPLVPAVQALVRDYRNPSLDSDSGEGERPLYALSGNDEDQSDET